MAAVTLFTACHDDDDEATLPSPEGSFTVNVVGGSAADGNGEAVVNWRASFESLQVSIDDIVGQASGRDANTSRILVSSDAEWLSVATDTLATDGIVAFVTKMNDTERRRTATLTFTEAAVAADGSSVGNATDETSALPRRGTVTVTQLSTADTDENGDAAREQLYVGYGYDIYKALESPMAVRTAVAVLDYEKMLELRSMYNFDVVQDCHLARTEIKYVATNDIHTYGEDLTQQQYEDKEYLIDGCQQSVIDATTYINEGSGSLEQHNFGHGSLEKAVAARVIDRGALMDLKRQYKMPYTQSFNLSVVDALKATGDRRQKLVEAILEKYGTHVILQADLGGRIDYTFSMAKEASFNSREEMMQEIEYTLGRISDSDRTCNNRQPSSSKSKEGAITVRGGSDTTRARLEQDIRSLTGSGQLPPDHITEWLATINYSNNPERDPNLDVIHFELIPLWDIVPDDLRMDFLNATLLMTMRSDCAYPRSFLGTDIYEINPYGTEADLFTFPAVATTVPAASASVSAALSSISPAESRASSSTLFDNPDASLCRLLYYDGEPVLEVCSEYVPKIRTDERVTVVYPIYKQHIRMNQGIFIGDGVHQPAYVGFSVADCYVNPLEDSRPGDLVETMYYVNGNLLLTNPTNIEGLKGNDRQVKPDVLQLYTDTRDGAITHRHPIVKVGNCFWTRYDIQHEMFFSRENHNSSLDKMVDGVLYTRFQWTPNKTFTRRNSWIFDYDPNTFYLDNPNKKWYLPTSAQVKSLYSFLGFNPKALFRGQQSGWEAQFNGYYGWNDIMDGNKDFPGKDIIIRYKDVLNVICSKDSKDSNDACLMVLDKDYKLHMIDDKTYLGEDSLEWRTNYYPVRPVRNYMFEYPTLKTIQENTYNF